MRLCVTFPLACVSLALLWGRGCQASPLLFNMSMDSSGDGGELELLFPVADATRAPVQINVSPTATAAPGAGGGAKGIIPTIKDTITTTMIRLKDFVFTRVVDFLQEYMLMIIVLSSLLIVMVFIICCASAMSHKRKLEAYKAPANPTRKYVDQVKPSSELQDRPYAVDHVQRVQGKASPTLRTPSKALVGEREGRDIKPRHQEVKKVRVAEEEEERRREEYKQEFKQEFKQAKQREEAQQTSSQPVVCTCHLRKANH